MWDACVVVARWMPRGLDRTVPQGVRYVGLTSGPPLDVQLHLGHGPAVFAGGGAGIRVHGTHAVRAARLGW